MTHGVKSAERVLAIFELFEAEQRPMRVSEISKKLQIPQASTSNLMNTLKTEGVFEYDGEDRTYLPSVRLAFLGNWVLGANNVMAQIQALIQKLATETGETAIVAAQKGVNIQYLSLIVSEHLVPWALRPGITRPLHLSGLGLMVLSKKSDEEIGRLMHCFNNKVPEGRAAAKVSTVLTRVREARNVGYCETANLASPGAGVIATLLPLPIGGRHLAIGLGAPVERLKERRDKLLDALQTKVGHFVETDLNHKNEA